MKLADGMFDDRFFVRSRAAEKLWSRASADGLLPGLCDAFEIPVKFFGSVSLANISPVFRFCFEYPALCWLEAVAAAVGFSFVS